MHQVEQGDAIEFLEGLDAESVDLMLTDPAYESLEKHRSRGTTVRLKNWFPIFPNSRFPDLFREAHRVLAKDAHLYVLCDQTTSRHIIPLGEMMGFKFWKPIIWDKMAMGMGYHYRARYEMVLFFEKGKKRLNDLGVPDVLQYKRVRGGYPTEKPVGLLRQLIKQSTVPGETVCDPFCGSGATAEASDLEGRRFTGCDISEEAVILARKRAGL